jgi:hypothetical protein
MSGYFGSNYWGSAYFASNYFRAASALPWNLFYGRTLPLYRKRRWPKWFGEKLNKITAANRRRNYQTFVPFSDDEIDGKWGQYLLQIDDLMVQGRPLKDAEAESFQAVADGVMFQWQ